VIRLVALLTFMLAVSAAQEHLDRGLRLYDLQQYDEAIREFRAGYALSPDPQFLYALGQAFRKKGDCPAAADAYRAYLRTAPAARQAQAAEDQIARCEPTAPAPAVAPAPPPPAAATVAPAPALPEAPPARPRRRVYTWIGVSLTAAAVIAGAALEIAAKLRYDSLLGSCAPPHGTGCSSGDIDALGREINGATGLFAAAGALGVATIVAITLESRKR
jgi:tetratricopeptide (TPR) repeat protein